MAKSRNIGGIYAELSLRDLKFRKGLKSAQASLGKFVSGVAATGAKMAVAGAAAAGAAITAVIATSITKASDLSETLSKSDVVFGNNSEAMKKWAKEGAKAFGQSQASALGAAASMGNMFVSMGLTSDKSAEMSKSMVELAADLASFNNTSTDEALEALGAGLRGEAEPLRRYGVLLDDATLKAEALERGLYSGKGSLTPMSRAMAAYGVILKQTGTAQGDFARTSDQLANTQRILAARLENASSSIGMALLPAVEKLAQLVNTIDFEGIAERIGNALADGLEIITDGKAWELFTLHAEKAIYDITSKGKFGAIVSSITDTLAASYNALNDESGQSFDDAFNKYADAGVEERMSASREIQDKIDLILAESRKNREDREAKKNLGEGKGATIPNQTPEWLKDGFGIPNSFDMRSGIKVEQPVSQLRDWESSSYSVNSMQARGLGMGGENVASQANKQITLLERMTKVLERAETNGGLQWA